MIHHSSGLHGFQTIIMQCLLSCIGPSSPSWPHSPCRFSQGSVRLFWNPPVVAPECCNNYTVQLSAGSVSNITKLSVTVPIRDEAIDGTVYCVGGGGEIATKSGVLTINPSKQ